MDTGCCNREQWPSSSHRRDAIKADMWTRKSRRIPLRSRTAHAGTPATRLAAGPTMASRYWSAELQAGGVCHLRALTIAAVGGGPEAGVDVHVKPPAGWAGGVSKHDSTCVVWRNVRTNGALLLPPVFSLLETASEDSHHRRCGSSMCQRRVFPVRRGTAAGSV